MTHALFTKHEDTLKRALAAIESRGYWSPFAEMPSPKVYGESGNADGEAAFKSHLGKTFELDQPASGETVGAERSPYGVALDIRYPKSTPDALIAAAAAAQRTWREAGPSAWIGVSLEILARLNRASFEIAYSVMHTTGQAFMMAFQAGGPHAQDRALEAVAYAWDQLRRIPADAHWEKPQGKNPPLAMQKRYTIVPRGTGLVLGCCTFPTWNGYPGLFADLATGNTVIVKPHPGAILPLAITVRIARDVLREAGFDPNVVTLLATEPNDGALVQDLALRPEIKLIDFTGSTQNGTWLERHAHQAQVYTEKAGVNQIVIDSTDDLKAAAKNIAFSLALYSGQMCTAPQNIYVPRDGIRTADGHASFDEVAQAIAGAVQKLTGDPARSVELIGAIQNDGVTARIDAARAVGRVLLDSQTLQHPAFPDARVRTPLVLQLDVADREKFTQEWFGPISFVIATDSTAQSLDLAGEIAAEHGALTLSVYSTADDVIDAAHEAAVRGGVALSINLTGGVFVNQSAAFSDFHGTGANPAANAALADAAFVANRFRVVQSRVHVAPKAAPAEVGQPA
ncbi:phenylacetic acid degradation protein PaaN [Burkholderia multivorans]|uniref:NAD-dependent aldehyde dehydrogenase n=2 Tax=Burkholderia multivorans (strain ATCC 17616 / 249) TaxID=395019 RepID=A0A0H3KBY8_BURM1|nr:phenylacetic acid degradation protein PaaN [Burkholderia multivorans]ABX16535.1 phenylacetic acid degradation protein paaN [Burkholderia multivorans ATCC 17616]MBU9137123.1 phenylacetic acid degradation protein PaaN [Burkholderia multivorans]MBU9234799.1 phenylacetic acid degradation protein PaaN [Burkholderia multivorans]MBU9522405.1 phenylacetic acid degradation protein PaaN [Burkholderia multivorans]MCO8628214.1 phenylacetic acid degradation protein PaaN [Burkholderia multivorans]